MTGLTRLRRSDLFPVLTVALKLTFNIVQRGNIQKRPHTRPEY